MTNQFPAFARIVHASFQRFSKSAVFTTSAAGDALYETYLASFPEGTNPTFKTKSEHDCSCCRGFIKRVGNVVIVSAENQVLTIWDEAAKTAPHPYNEVAAKLRDAVRASPVDSLFRVHTKEACFGAASTRSQEPDTKKVLTWDHFYTDQIHPTLRSPTPGQVSGDYNTTVNVFERGLREISPDALETILGLIAANNLYRGEEHKSAILHFQKSQKAYLALGSERHNYAWAHAGDPAARFRNTVIGTLATDLSDGVDLEAAVRSFESKVAPTNYKRTTALITPAMVAKAMKTIEELGLEPALERRFAQINDISVRDVLWVDGAARPLMKGGIGDLLVAHAKSTSASVVDESQSIAIGVDDFLQKVLPTATGLEVLFANEAIGNLMVITAPVHPEPRQLFRWSNDFAWSYGGNVTDSIRERVKKAGGHVDGAKLRVSLSWFNYDDLDIHCYEPKGRGTNALKGHIYYADRLGWTGGLLDVDMNAAGGRSREPVENIAWKSAVPDGAYRIAVNQYNQRETGDVGFVVEVECGEKISNFTYNKLVRGQIEVATLHMKDGAIKSIDVGDDAISTSAIKQEKWGLQTGQFAKARLVTLSPNFWGDNAVGNKHVFFVLEDAACDEPMRGIYNEFLNPRLEGHRKVFEIIGDKTKCAPTEKHLAGLGFSSTKKDSIVVRVASGKTRRLYNIKIG